MVTFNTEQLYDLVSIGNLLDINDLGSATIITSGNMDQTGTARPPAFLSTGEIVWARFVSDGSKTENGFTIRFSTRDDAGINYNSGYLKALKTKGVLALTTFGGGREK